MKHVEGYRALPSHTASGNDSRDANKTSMPSYGDRQQRPPAHLRRLVCRLVCRQQNFVLMSQSEMLWARTWTGIAVFFLTYEDRYI